MATESTSAFAQNLIRFRKRRGLSQYDMANLTGLSRRMISHYETHGILPPIEKLEILAKVLGIKASQLLEDPGKKELVTTDLSGIDPRSVKKLKDILSLPPEDRNVLYRMLNELLRKNQLEERERGSKKTATLAK